MNKDHKGRALKGSITVEMSYVLPLIIFVIFILIYTVFYYHDKAVLAGAVAETVEQGIEDIRNDNDEALDLEAYMKKRTGSKLIWLNVSSINISVSEEKVKVKADAQKKFFHTSVCLEGTVPYPEKKLREKKKVEDMLK